MNQIVRKLVFFAVLLKLPATAQVKVWTLKECLEQAIEKNVLLNQDKLLNGLNSIDLQQSKAARYPNLNLSENQNFSNGRAIDAVTGQLQPQDIVTNNLALNSSLTLFNGFQNYYTIRQNQYNYDAGMLDLEKLKNDLSLNVAAAYLQVLYNYETVEIAKSDVAATQSQLERMQKYVDAGKVPIGNLYQVQSLLAADKYAEINSENQLTLSKVALMQLMEMPVSLDFEIEKQMLSEPELNSSVSGDDIYKVAEQSQPQVKSAELKISSAYAGLKVAKGAMFPKLSVTGTLKTGYSSAATLSSYQTIVQQQTIGYLQSNPAEQVTGYVSSVNQENRSYPLDQQFKNNYVQLIGLSLSVPVFNNLQVKSNVERAKINLQSVQLDEQNTKNQLRKNIEQAYADQLGAAKQYIAAQEQQRAEDRTYTDAKQKFDNGLITATDFIIEKNNYDKAKLALIQAKYSYVFKVKVVDFYLGKPLTTL